MLFIGHKLMMDAASPSCVMQPLWRTFICFMSIAKYSQIICLFFTLYSFLLLIFRFDSFFYTTMSETWEYPLWFNIRPGAAGVLKAERHSINPMKNMFTGKQNVINPTIYQVFDRKQKAAGILPTSVSCDANGQKSWNHSLERQGGTEGRERNKSQGGFN